RRLGAALAAGENMLALETGEGLIAVRFQNMIVDIVALALRGEAERPPGGALLVAGDKPCERPAAGLGPRLWLLVGDCGFVFSLEIFRPIFGLHPHTLASGHVDVPAHLSVAGDIAVEVLRARARHVGHQSLGSRIRATGRSGAPAGDSGDNSAAETVAGPSTGSRRTSPSR